MRKVFLTTLLIALFQFVRPLPLFAEVERDILTHEMAIQRKGYVGSLDYQLTFEFKANSSQFSGISNILADVHADKMPDFLRIDAKVDQINSVRVDAQSVSDFHLKAGTLLIPQKYFGRGSARYQIEIVFGASFSPQGHGLSRFVDPLDKREYIFSDSEPYGAHLFFPCFDQPDLKARFELKIVTPEGWVAIGNAPIARVEKDQQRRIQTTLFKQSLPISTYLVFVGAGNYAQWKDQAEDIPLTIYARQSLAQYMDTPQLFLETKRGLKFFGTYFGMKYPFEKYDHIFAPGLSPGAMENPGAVTMNENMIFRGARTDDALWGRENTLLHEMAHMWFGDLVTMQWWSDLWLNESFATYMAYLAQSQWHGSQTAWNDFQGIQAWARDTDQLPTTHPIVTLVPDTDVSSSNFDGITYGKGASVLKQLHFYIGDHYFQQGLQDYFAKHAFSNTTYVDFMGAMANAAGKDLSSWTDGWLRAEGINRIQPLWSCKGGVINSFILQVKATKADLILPHRTKIGFFYYSDTKQGRRLEVRDVIDFAYVDAWSSVKEAQGLPCPDLVYPNYESYDYAVVELDPQSAATVRESISKVSHVLTRKGLWDDYYQGVFDLRFKASDLIAMSQSHIYQEEDPVTLSYLLGRNFGLSEIYWKVLTPSERDRVAPFFEENSWQKYEQASSTNENLKIEWLEHFIAMAHTKEAEARLGMLMSDKSLDQDIRWNVLKALARMNFPNIQQLIETELRNDPSAKGEVEAFAANVAIGDLAHKQTAWKALSQAGTVSPEKKKVGGRVFQDRDRPELMSHFVDPFFELLANYDWTKSWGLKTVFSYLFPSSLCRSDVLEKSEQNLSVMKSIPDSAQRYWIEANFELRKCLEMRNRNQ